MPPPPDEPPPSPRRAYGVALRRNESRSERQAPRQDQDRRPSGHRDLHGHPANTMRCLATRVPMWTDCYWAEFADLKRLARRKSRRFEPPSPAGTPPVERTLPYILLRVANGKELHCSCPAASLRDLYARTSSTISASRREISRCSPRRGPSPGRGRPPSRHVEDWPWWAARGPASPSPVEGGLPIGPREVDVRRPPRRRARGLRGFNLRLARELRRRGVSVVYYVCPRSGRGDEAGSRPSGRALPTWS